MEEWEEKELSHYGSDLTEISELNPSPQLEKLRILHCERLENMLDIASLTHLQEINLSSNSIARIEGLHHMANLRVLNLSCNRIRVINGLQNLYCLERLNLSFNKLSGLGNLRQLYGCQAFVHLDLRGNNLTQLQEIQYLRGCQSLQEVLFHGGSGSNAVARMTEYRSTVLRVLPEIQQLDGVAISQENLPPEREKPVSEAPPCFQKDPVQPHQIQKQIQESIPQQPIESIPNPSAPSFFPDHLNEIRKLQHEKEELYSQFKDLGLKYQTEERFYTSKFERQETELNELTKQLHTAEIELRSQAKDLQTKEVQLLAIQEQLKMTIGGKDAKDKTISDLHERVSSLMNEVSSAKSTALESEERARMSETRARALELEVEKLRMAIKQAETSLTVLHSSSLETSNRYVQKSDILQDKVDTLTQQLSAKDDEIVNLQNKNKEILSLNAKFDENWSAKYEESLHNKDHIIASLQRQIEELALTSKSAVQAMILQEREFKHRELMELESKYREEIATSRDTQRQAEMSMEQTKKEHADLQAMLKLTVDKEAKAQDFISEMTEIIKQLQVKIDMQQQEKLSNHMEFESCAKELADEITRLSGEVNKLKNQIEQKSAQIIEAESTLTEKTRHLTLARREVQEASDSLDDARAAISQLKARIKKEESCASNEIYDLETRVKELELTLGTKNAIIEDKTNANRVLKDQLEVIQMEIEGIKANKSSYRDNFEEKLNSAYDEIERISAQQVQTEDDFKNAKEAYATSKDQIKELQEALEATQAKLEEKKEAVRFFEQEFESLRDDCDTKAEKLKELSAKDQILIEHKGFISELNLSLKNKDEESKQVLLSLNALQMEKNALAQDNLQLQARLAETENEMRVVLTEMDRQKSEAAETVAQLQKMFS